VLRFAVVRPNCGHFLENFMKKLSYIVASNTGVDAKVALAFLRHAAQSHSARMAHASPARTVEVQAHYRAWLAQVRAERRLPYYGAYLDQESVYFA
jgi:hypothetical protein